MLLFGNREQAGNFHTTSCKHTLSLLIIRSEPSFLLYTLNMVRVWMHVTVESMQKPESVYNARVANYASV